MVCLMNELLELDIGMKVLEIGTGSGYHAATIAEIVAPSNVDRSKWGKVYSIEIDKVLAQRAIQNLKAAGYYERVTVIVGDGSVGYPPHAPYDRILVTAAAPRVPPPLVDQLIPGGLMVIPIGPPHSLWGQELIVVKKDYSGAVSTRKAGVVAFVPLRGKEGWR